MYTLLRNALMLVFVAIAISSQATILNYNVQNYSFTPSITNRTICLGDTVKWTWVNGSHTTTSTSLPAGATATWNSNIDNVTTSFMYVPAVAGTYYFQCTPHSSIMFDSFFVNPVPAPGITALNGVVACQGTPVSLNVQPVQTGVSYQWYSGTTAIPGATTSNLFAIASGSYTVKGTNSCGVVTSTPINVTINPAPPVPSLTQTHAGATYSFSSNAAASGLGYLWDFADGNTSTAMTPPAHTYITAGFKTVSLQLTNANNCSSSGNLTINVSLSVATIGGKHSITIAPNPASNLIVLHTDGAKVNVTLADAMGRMVNNAPQSTSGNDIMIDVRSLAAGTYIVKMSIDGASATEKIEVVR